MMQKPEAKMSFVHPESWPPSSQTGPFDILHQPFEATECTEPWCRTRNAVVVQ